MPKLHVIIASTRPGRAGLAIGKWFEARAREHGQFDVELVDLREVNLPLLDEPKHPRLKQYEHDHTKRWSASVTAADAFVFVMPEYNYGIAPSLANAIDYLFQEWAYKPVGLVSYGGASGGLRAAQMTKQIVTTLKMMPIPEAVSIPFFSKLMDENGVFLGGESHDGASKAMLDELLRWTNAMRTLRA